LLHDAFGGYRAPLLLAATVDVVAALVILGGRAGKAVPPTDKPHGTSPSSSS
jgi:hypothetical protein